jgi:L-serine dehydratase
MTISIFDLFKIGIGPSSSHTVGPMKAARAFADGLVRTERLHATRTVRAELYGSLGLTGRGHGADKAVMLGLEGDTPESVDVDSIPARLEAIRAAATLNVLGAHPVAFVEREHLVFHKRERLPYHPNGMRFLAWDADGNTLSERIYYSVGGGFVVDEHAASADKLKEDDTPVRYPFASGAQLLEHCAREQLAISDLMLANEQAWRPAAEVREKLLAIWHAMQASVARGCSVQGVMPGLKVRRRAADLLRQLTAQSQAELGDPLTVMDWVNLYALAVNEENATGGRVVTAPTNGAAGIVPAVLHYYARFCPGACEDGIVRFLLTAGAIGVLYKENASISGAEVGCQGEVGTACSMAAGALAEVLGGTPAQVENAAEIGMEHNLGLTCDPIAGLVQIPCIERNAMGAVKAINSARLALRGDGRHYVSLDEVIETMRQTGRDMQDKYKETARGGLAANVIEMPVNVTEC